MRWWLVAVEFGRFNQSLVHSRHQMIVTQTALVIMHSQQTNSQTAKREEKSLTFFPFCRSIAIFILLTYFNINCQWHAYRWHCSLCARVCVSRPATSMCKNQTIAVWFVCVFIFPFVFFSPSTNEQWDTAVSNWNCATDIHFSLSLADRQTKNIWNRTFQYETYWNMESSEGFGFRTVNE